MTQSAYPTQRPKPSTKATGHRPAPYAGRQGALTRSSIFPGLALWLLLIGACNASDSLPSSLGGVRLGAAPSASLLVESGTDAVSILAAGRVRDLKPDAARHVWQRLIPDVAAQEVTGSVSLYQGKVVVISLFSSDLPFQQVQAAIVRRLGKGNALKNYIEDVPEGCEPYAFDRWNQRSLGLYLLGERSRPGVGVHLRDDDLNYKLSMDPTVHLEYEQCGEF